MADDSAAPFRRVLLGLAALGIVGTTVELTMLRHWGTGIRVIPFVMAAVLALAILLGWQASSRATVKAARVLTIAVSVASLFGIWEHLHSNYETAPLDFRYTDKWATMSLLSKWWAAFNGSVGPAPVLAAGVLVQAALCVWFATWRHPVLAGD